MAKRQRTQDEEDTLADEQRDARPTTNDAKQDLLTRLFTTTSIQGVWVKILVEFAASPLEPLAMCEVRTSVREALERSSFFEIAMERWRARFSGVTQPPQIATCNESSSSSTSLAGARVESRRTSANKRSMYDSSRKRYEHFVRVAAMNATEVHAEVFEMNAAKLFTFSKFRRLLHSSTPIWVDYQTTSGSLLLELLRIVKFSAREQGTKLLSCVKLLVEEYNADPNGSSRDASPLAYAALRGAEAVVTYLLPRVSRERREGKVVITPAFRVRDLISVKGEFDSPAAVVTGVISRLRQMMRDQTMGGASANELAEMLVSYQRCEEVLGAKVNETPLIKL